MDYRRGPCHPAYPLYHPRRRTSKPPRNHRSDRVPHDRWPAADLPRGLPWITPFRKEDHPGRLGAHLHALSPLLHDGHHHLLPTRGDDTQPILPIAATTLITRQP